MWYARYWDSSLNRYAVTRSTGVLVEGKRERKAEADERARAMLPEIKFKITVGDMLFTDYLLDFWREDSDYARERALVYKKPLSREYIKIARDGVRLHVVPYPKMKGIHLDEISPAIVRDWMVWGAAKGMSGKRINTIFEAMRVAVRWAYMREEIKNNPFGLIKKAHHEAKERGIINTDEVASIVNLVDIDHQRKLIVMLGMLCGMRCGEVRGLQWGDIDSDARMINLRHNFVALDGLKNPKAGSTRKVPIPAAVLEEIELVRESSRWVDDGDYLFPSADKRAEPRGSHFVRYSLELVLDAIGIDRAAQKARNITFHGMRHTFVTLGRMSGIPDLVIQALAGHKTASMMQHYSHASQVINFDEARKKLESIQGNAKKTATERVI
jgi:integrase